MAPDSPRSRPPASAHETIWPAVWDDPGARRVILKEDATLVGQDDGQGTERMYLGPMQTPGHLLARVRGMDPFRFDAAFTALLLAGALTEIPLLHNPDGYSRPLTVVITLLALPPLVVRRRFPLEVTLWMMAVLLVNTQLNTMYMTTMTTPFLAIGVAVYSLGRYTQGRRVVIGGAAFYLSVVAITVLLDPTPGDDNNGVVITALWGFALLVPPLLVGRVMRRRIEMQEQLRELTARLEADARTRAERAVHTERGRIAEELQTLVANNVSAMVVQAGVVRPALDIPAPETARTALATVEETGRDALVEMRRLLGVLRRDGERPALAPQPSLERAEALVERVRAEGLDVSLEVEGEPANLSAGVDLAAYRVLQEALDSAAGTAGVSAAAVKVIYAANDVTLVVRDDRDTGRGLEADRLTALRERVGLYGGTLRAGPPREGSGFRLSARLPREVVS
jgi:signal transduction histidine kinase